MNILYQFDNRYAPYAGVSITSLFINNQECKEIIVYILGSGISSANQEKLQILGEKYQREIVFLQTEHLEKLIIEMGIPSYRGSVTANLRLFASKVIPEKVERLLYVDSDTLILGPLWSFMETNLQGKAVGMIQDSLVRGHKKHIGFEKNRPYFNSGVLLFDMKRWRAQSCTERIVEHVKSQKANYVNPDQDLLNVVLKEDIYMLSPRYNFQPIHSAFSTKDYFRIYGHAGYYEREEIEQAKERPAILHFFRFLGEFPWNKENAHPYRTEYEKYKQESLWKDEEDLELPKSIVFSIEKWIYLHCNSICFLWFFHSFHEIYTSILNARLKKNRKEK